MKNRIADATAQHRAIRQGARLCRRGCCKEAEISAAGFFLSSLPQQEKRAFRCFRPQAQTTALRQAEGLWVAADLQNRRRKNAAFDCRFRKPESVFKLARTGIEELVRFQTEIS